MTQGFARFTNNGEVVLGLINSAPIFEKLAPDNPTLELIAADDNETIVAFSVVKASDGRFGFLWYDENDAIKSAAYLSKELGFDYVVLPLKVKQ